MRAQLARERGINEIEEIAAQKIVKKELEKAEKY